MSMRLGPVPKAVETEKIEGEEDEMEARVSIKKCSNMKT
jgi:hypothetical protein